MERRRSWKGGVVAVDVDRIDRSQPLVPEDEEDGTILRSSFNATPRLQRQSSGVGLARQGSFSGANRRPSAGRHEMSIAAESAVDVVTTTTKEKTLVERTQIARRRKPGRSIASILKNPRRSGGEAPAERGPSLLTDSIVVGGRDESNNLDVLKSLGITHILNAAASLPNCFEDVFIYKNIPLHDTDDEQILDVMGDASLFIRRVEEMKGRVLVHCISGVSRSVTICLMHLVMEHHIPLKDAWNYVYSCRPFIAPNDGFKLQLAQAEIASLKYSSVCNSDSGSQWNFFEWNRIRQSIQQKQATSRQNRGSNTESSFESGCCPM
jgi:hypothetical protein